jgi:uncharacterized protein YndB with AHSA1/START domain
VKSDEEENNVPNTIRLHRVIATRPEKVYRAFLESDAIASWLPAAWFMGDFDCRAGGRSPR